jgi:hypothetical protein
VRKAEGVSMLFLPGMPVQERKTFTCLHCGHVRRVNDQTLGWCSGCDARVCNDRACACECVAFKRKLDLAEARARFRREV